MTSSPVSCITEKAVMTIILKVTLMLRLNFLNYISNVI